MHLTKIFSEYGVKNLRFFIPMRPLQFVGLIPRIAFTNSSTPEDIVECEIDEHRYKVVDNYKITLQAIENPEVAKRLYGRKDYYISDLNSLLHEQPDKFRVYALTIDGYVRLTVDYGDD